MTGAEKTDEQITADAVRAGNIARAAAGEDVGLTSDAIHNAVSSAIAQTVALEVAKPKVTVAGGTIDKVGKIDGQVTVTGKVMTF